MNKQSKIYSTLLKPMTLPLIFATLFGFMGYAVATLVPALSILIWFQDLSLNFSNYILILLILCAFLRGIFRYLEQLLNHFIAFKILEQMRSKVFNHLRTLSSNELQSMDKGALLDQTTRDIELTEVFFAHTLSPVLIWVLYTSIIFVGFYIVLGSISFIPLLSYIVIAIIIPFSFKNKVMNKGTLYRSKSNKANAVFHEALEGHIDLNQYNATQRFSSAINDQFSKVHKTKYELNRYRSRITLLVELTYFAAIILLTGIVYTYHPNYLIPASLIFVSSFGPSIVVSQLSNDLPQTFASMKRLSDLLNIQTNVPEIADKFSPVEGSLKLHDVSFDYGTPLLKDINLEFKNSSIIGIKGKSGSGKSTLFKLLSRNLLPNSGMITLNGIDINNLNSIEFRECVGVMTQDTDIFNTTIRENITLGKPFSNQAVEEACRKAGIHQFIDALPQKYDTLLSRTNGVSTGEKQRIGLARLFLSNANVYLLDEPTSNLDSFTEAHILKSIINNQEGKLIIISSHRESVLKISDSIIDMKELAIQN